MMVVPHSTYFNVIFTNFKKTAVHIPKTIANNDDASANSADTATPDDDLTTIVGIGKTTAERLHAAGITTFHQLATAEPSTIATITKANINSVLSWQKKAATGQKRPG